MVEPTIDFAIITAIEIERKAVCKAFGLTDEDKSLEGVRVYWRGKLQDRKGRKFYKIVVAQSLDMASVKSVMKREDTSGV